MSAHERERLSAYLDEELPVDERAEVAAHLATCSECRTALSEMAALGERARELPLAAPPGYFDTLPGRVRARVEGLSPTRRTAPPARRRGLPTWTWAAAAALILGVVTPLTLREMRPASPERPATAVEMPQSAPAPEGRGSGVEGLLEDRDDEAAPAAMDTREGRTRLRAQEAVAEPEAVLRQLPRRHHLPPARRGRAERRMRWLPPSGSPRPHRIVHWSSRRTVEPSPRPPPSRWRRPSRSRRRPPLLRVRHARKPRSRRTPCPRGPPASRRWEGRRRWHSRQLPGPRGRSGPEATGPGRQEGRPGRGRALIRRAGPRNAPADAAGWRERREAWRAFVAEHPESPDTDEARVRVIEAGLQAWRAGGDSADLELAREDAAAYLARDDAALGQRVRRALESADRE